MKKRLGLLALALLCLLAANLNLSYRVSVNGRPVEGLYSAETVRRCENAAMEAAEEILQGPAKAPALTRRMHLGLGREDGNERELTDTLLRSVSGVTLSDCVIVNGTRLGTVRDGEALMEKLRQSIRGQMPNAAVFGNISGRVQIQKIYSRAGHDTPDEDMILLITDMAPVVYVDKDGKLA